MSNLGWYQVMTTTAKKVGGMENMVGLLVGGGVVLGGCVVAGGIAVKHKIDNVLDEKKKERETAIIHTVITEGQSNEGLTFKPGDQFRVLELDGDATLIERMNDENNPYFVSAEFLRSISDYE